MKKSLFYWAFLVVAGMSLTACSSGDDNIADNTTPVTPGSQNKTVILTGTIGVGGDEATRAVDDKGITSWKANDPITINYETALGGYSRANGTIKQVSSDNHFATFEAMLENPKNDGYIGFAYGTVKPADPSPGSAYDFTFNYDAYSTQYGTTAAITSSGLDYACTEEGGEVKMAVDNNKATLKSTALLKNQFSMFEFILKDGNDDEVEATGLQIFIKNGDSFSSTADYIVTPTPATSKFYVALEPTPDNATIDGVKIVASFNNQAAAKKLDADGVTAMETGDEGNYICVDKSAGTNQYQAYIYPSLENPKVCEHTYGKSKFVKGKLYSADLTVKDLTPVAVIAHVGAVTGYWDKFLAFAINDVPTASTVTLADGQDAVNTWVSSHIVKINGQTYNSFYNDRYDLVAPNTDASQASSWSKSNTASATVPAKWRVPSVTDWRYIIQNFDGGRSATDPKGVMDYNGKYPGESSPGYTSPVGSTGAVLDLFSKINTACDNDDLQGVVYWTSSQYEYTPPTEPYTPVMKTWRWDFAYGYFVWNSGEDQARIRLVLAY